MVFSSVDEVAEFVALMRMVADRRGVVGFRRVAQLFGVSASVVRTIEARAAHLIGPPPTALAVQLSARWNAAHLLQSPADEDLGRSTSPLADALAVLQLRLRSLPLAAFVERSAMLFASLKGRHLIALQAGQVMSGGDPDADDIDDFMGSRRLDALLRSALQLERGGAPPAGECRWYSVIPACTAPLAAWEHTDPPWPTIPGTDAPLDTARERALLFSRLGSFCRRVDAAAAGVSAPPHARHCSLRRRGGAHLHARGGCSREGECRDARGRGRLRGEHRTHVRRAASRRDCGRGTGGGRGVRSRRAAGPTRFDTAPVSAEAW